METTILEKVQEIKIPSVHIKREGSRMGEEIK